MQTDLENFIEENKEDIDHCYWGMLYIKANHQGILTEWNTLLCDNAEDVLEDAYVVPPEMFYGAKSTECVLPAQITRISTYAFHNCLDLETIILPKDLAIINDKAFMNCTSLKDIILPDGLLDIGAFAFANCASLEKIVIPDSVNKIEHHAFFLSGIKFISVPKKFSWDLDKLLPEWFVENTVEEVLKYVKVEVRD